VNGIASPTPSEPTNSVAAELRQTTRAKPMIERIAR
jgi:hypothetical protein